MQVAVSERVEQFILPSLQKQTRDGSEDINERSFW